MSHQSLFVSLGSYSDSFNLFVSFSFYPLLLYSVEDVDYDYYLPRLFKSSSSSAEDSILSRTFSRPKVFENLFGLELGSCYRVTRSLFIPCDCLIMKYVKPQKKANLAKKSKHSKLLNKGIERIFI